MRQRLLQRRDQLQHLHLLQPRLLLLYLKRPSQLKPASLLGSKACLVPVNQPLLHLCVLQLMVRSVTAVATLHNGVSNAIHVVSALSAPKVKANAVTDVVATRAVAVGVNVAQNALANVAQSAMVNAPQNAVTMHALIRVANRVLTTEARVVLKAETKGVAHVLAAEINGMTRAMMPV